jgi:hypothetical protein
VAGRFTFSMRRPSRHRRPKSSASAPAMCSTGQGQRWDRRGPGTIALASTIVAS